MSVIHTQGKPVADVRLLAFPVLCGFFLLILFFRLWYFQVVLSASLTEKAALSRRNSPSVMAPRGRIFDRNGKLLAGVEQELIVTGIPMVLKAHPEVLTKLAALLGTTEKKLHSKLGKGLNPRLSTPIFMGVPIDVGTRILEGRDDLPGIDVQTEPMRYYADTIDFTHVLGDVRVPDENDVKRLAKEDVNPAEYVGKAGVEWFYEKILMGEPGTQVIESDAKHRPVRVVGGDPAVPGSQLTLSVDQELQKLAKAELVYPGDYKDRALRGKPRRGAVVAIDPNTGEILCMYSSPSFDIDAYKDDFESINADPDKPQMNRAVSGVYAPGSTFKIITSVAMQETGILDTNAKVFCDGAFHAKKATVKCLGHHGWISYTEALYKSCNTYFCTMGTRVGPAALAKAAREMGLGTSVGLDSRSDTFGSVVPDREYKESKKKGKWYEGDTANTAIGQGFVLASPLQMADVAAMVANRGVMYKPHLVRSIRAPGEAESTRVKPVIAHQIDMPASFWDILCNGLRDVLDEKHGTAYSCRIQGLEWAGKTGSAEHKLDEKTHSWFIGFAPLDHPQIAIAVLVESAGHGSDVAGPIARDVVQHYLFPPKTPETSANTRSSSASDASTLAASAGRPSAR